MSTAGRRRAFDLVIAIAIGVVYAVTVVLVALGIGWLIPLSITLVGLALLAAATWWWPRSPRLRIALGPEAPFLRSFAATLLSIALLPALAWLWLGVTWSLAVLPVVRRWTDAPWWKPYGYYGFGLFEVALAVGLIVADVAAGIWTWRRLGALLRRRIR